MKKIIVEFCFLAFGIEFSWLPGYFFCYAGKLDTFVLGGDDKTKSLKEKMAEITKR